MDKVEGRIVQNDEYVVLKVSDVIDALSPEEINNLETYKKKIAEHRQSRGDKPLTCMVIEDSYPLFPSIARRHRLWNECPQKFGNGSFSSLHLPDQLLTECAVTYKVDDSQAFIDDALLGIELDAMSEDEDCGFSITSTKLNWEKTDEAMQKDELKRREMEEEMFSGILTRKASKDLYSNQSLLNHREMGYLLFHAFHIDHPERVVLGEKWDKTQSLGYISEDIKQMCVKYAHYCEWYMYLLVAGCYSMRFMTGEDQYLRAEEDWMMLAHIYLAEHCPSSDTTEVSPEALTDLFIQQVKDLREYFKSNQAVIKLMLDNIEHSNSLESCEIEYYLNQVVFPLKTNIQSIPF